MKIKVEHKYTRIRKRLENDIRKGCFKNNKLPALKNLCDQYGTSLVTINKVVKLLEKEGLVTCYTGAKGTWVNEQLPVAMPGVDEKSDPVDMSPFVNKKVKLKYFSLDYSSETQEMWEKITTLFSEKYPWIDVEMVPSNTRTQIDNIRDLENIDIIQIGAQDLKSLKNGSNIMSLHTFLEGDTSVNSKKFLSPIWDACVVDNELMAMPMYFSVPLLYYRDKRHPELIEKSMREKGINWNDFISIMNKVRQTGSDISLNIGLWTLWQSIFGQLNAKVFTSRNAENKLLDSIRLIEKVTEKAENKFDLIKVYQHRGGINKFADGELDIFCGYSFLLSQLKRKKTKSWRLCPIPQELPNGKTMLIAVVNAIHPASRNKPEAWFFMRFLASEKAQRILGEYCYLPSEYETLKENLFSQKNLDCPDKVLERIDNGSCWNLSSHSAFVVYHNYIYPALNDYLNHKIDIDEVIYKVKKCFSEVLPVYELEYKLRE